MSTEYDVGYGKPPVEGQFKPGQSGNPKGRPAGSKNTATLVYEKLNQRVDMNINGERKRMSKREIICEQAVNKAVKGDMKAFDRVVALEQTHLDDEGRKLKSSQSTTLDDDKIIKDYVQRHLEEASDGA